MGVIGRLAVRCSACCAIGETCVGLERGRVVWGGGGVFLCCVFDCLVG